MAPDSEFYALGLFTQLSIVFPKQDAVIAVFAAIDPYPIYYITGTIHSTETGSPTAMMELAYRLAVNDSPYIK